MKNLFSIFSLFCVIVALSAVSCKKKANSVPPIVDTAGKGGTTTLIVLPQHHNISKNINTCEVYIKYNAQNTPSAYDDSTACTFANGVVTCQFTNLKNGDYYLYGRGYDTSVQRVVGGGLYSPISKQSAITTVSLAVSEL
jgi:hypothetical protein